MQSFVKYGIDGNRLYHVDCMEFMKDIPDGYYELAIVDPPYGGNDAIDLKDNKKKSKQATQRTNYKVFKNIEPTEEYWSELIRISRNQIIWGVNFYTKINLSGGRLIWDKKGTAFGRAEAAYLSMTKSVNIFEYTWNGMIQQKMKNKEARIHPTQKPVALYKWLIQNYAKPGDKLLDTHSGSGSFRIAAYDMGFSLDSCELDADYCESNEKRFQEHIKQGDLFGGAEYQELIFVDKK